MLCLSTIGLVPLYPQLYFKQVPHNSINPAHFLYPNTVTHLAFSIKCLDFQDLHLFFKRHIPVDMAGFAIHVSMIVRKPKVRFGFKSDQVHHSKAGYLEPDFLKSLGTNRKTVECRGMENEVSSAVIVIVVVVVVIVAVCI